jgi:hypothetical protein
MVALAKLWNSSIPFLSFMALPLFKVMIIYMATHSLQVLIFIISGPNNLLGFEMNFHLQN